jgi:hypothetical protein
MACKVVFFYNQDAQGFSETYYHNSTNPFTLANGLGDGLFASAIAMRGAGTQLLGVRCTLQDQFVRTSFTRLLGNTYLVSGGPSTSTNPDVTSTAGLIKLIDNSGQSRKLYLRGLKDNDVLRDANGFIQTTARLNGQLKKFVSYLSANGLCIRTGVRPPNGTLIWNAVKQIEPVATGSPNTKIDLFAGSGYVAGTTVIFQGIDRDVLPGFPRSAVVVDHVEAAPASITIPYTYRAATDVVIPAKPVKFTAVKFNYTTIQDYELENWTEHKTGRAFGVPRGRLRSVVRAH